MSHRLLQFAGFCSVFFGIVLFCVVLGGYTSFWRSQNRIEASKALLTDACQNRLDLLPELIEITKKNKMQAIGPEINQAAQKAMTILQKTITQETPLEKALIKEFEISQSKLTLQLKDLFTQLEGSSDKNFQQFKAVRSLLFAAQDNLFVTKKRYNDEANYFNTRAAAFPTSLFAKLFRFNKMKYIEISKDLFLPANKVFAPSTS
ncbi:LemA family protein [Desulfobacula sp.]|uniref:LemA family protein n=1 Tax=Desulfobacula sp. TaxID=2593537 RepID=UPI0025C70634|nr:LemA family protein [Desulfobacula sp.]MBC2704003.1 LemA family protein [Desulfobacula sp.]